MYLKKEELREQVLAKLKGKWNAKGSFMTFSDNKFYMPSYEEFYNYIRANETVLAPKTELSKTEGFDCDDYSFLLKGHVGLYNREVAKKEHSWAVGIIWANFSWIKKFHAANLVATSDKGLMLFEPQYGINGFYDFFECRGKVQLVLV